MYIFLYINNYVQFLASELCLRRVRHVIFVLLFFSIYKHIQTFIVKITGNQQILASGLGGNKYTYKYTQLF